MTNTQIEGALKTLIEQKNIAAESLTRDQLAEAFLQALASGDFVRNVRVDNEAQQVNYIPYREVERLKDQIAVMRAVLGNFRTLFEAQYGPNPTGQPLSKHEIQFVRRQFRAILNTPPE